MLAKIRPPHCTIIYLALRRLATITQLEICLEELSTLNNFNTVGFISDLRIGRGMILIKALMKLDKSSIPLPHSSSFSPVIRNAYS